MPITRRRRANPPDEPENNNNHLVEQTEQAAETLAAEQASSTPVEGDYRAAPAHERLDNALPTAPSTPSMTNGDRVDRQEYTPPPSIEGGRRTARGEFFRRPPQMPTPAPAAFTPSSLQAPTHEIALPLGNLLHLAYNPGYTGSDEARSLLLQRLSEETKAGGRARCWNCGSIAIAYDRWNTRSKTFGEVGIAFCEICGVWSVM